MKLMHSLKMNLLDQWYTSGEADGTELACKPSTYARDPIPTASRDNRENCVYLNLSQSKGKPVKDFLFPTRIFRNLKWFFHSICNTTILIAKQNPDANITVEMYISFSFLQFVNFDANAYMPRIVLFH